MGEGPPPREGLDETDGELTPELDEPPGPGMVHPVRTSRTTVATTVVTAPRMLVGTRRKDSGRRGTRAILSAGPEPLP